MATNKQVLNRHLKKRADELKGSLRAKCEQELSENPAYRGRREDTFKEKVRRKEKKHKNNFY
jgi:hypothetical protein